MGGGEQRGMVEEFWHRRKMPIHLLQRDVEPIHVNVRLSRDAVAYLRRQGYSQRFCDALAMLLQTMTNAVINSAENADTLRRQRERRSLTDGTFPEAPVRAKMPTNLRSSWMFHGLGTGEPALMMPFEAPYYPDRTHYPEVNRAFSSAEGQRFMKRYYTTGWLRQDERSGEWIVAPPAPPRDVVPRRTER
ncbi:MAG: hypothetical protein AB1529_00970 [Candidatus Micrarchaeota archaeon]